MLFLLQKTPLLLHNCTKKGKCGKILVFKVISYLNNNDSQIQSQWIFESCINLFPCLQCMAHM